VARSVRESVVLAASPEAVWDVVMDPSQLELWVTTHDSYADAGPGALGQDDEFTQKLRLAGKSFEVRWKVVEADRPSLARWEGDGPAGSTANVSYRLAEEDGGTRFDYENEFALPGGVLGKAAGGLLSAAPGGREARRSLERLRTLLE
jgi:uncharacterized protein YndB with AHSA1/START domain